MKVALWPTPDEIQPNHGIGRIVHAQFQYLPQLGIELTDADQADVIAVHTQQFDMPRVDVLHLHGMYWSGDPGSGVYEQWHHHANRKIVEAARLAGVITVPSQWCTEAFRRDMRLIPSVVGHGIDFDQWEPADSFQNYLLWNKNRNSDVCDPTPAMHMAERGARVVSTYAAQGRATPENMTVLGTLSHDQMRMLVRHAGVYLATVKETYGIGTLEAMASGVPVLGYRWGGTEELIEHKVTGYLAEPGDEEDLWVGYAYCQKYRKELGANAREFARTRDWPLVIGGYAEVYQEALTKRQVSNHDVSIVITNYNYGKYVGEAIQSALEQSIPVEVVVVDDGSTDNSRSIIEQAAKSNPSRVKVIFQQNAGVASARNAGIRASRGAYIVCLDADDRIDPVYSQVLANALHNDRSLGVAYTGLGILGESGSLSPNAWPPPFDWETQSSPHVPPQNCVPCAAMFRKDMWHRAGGYQQEYAPGEDTEFFTRGLSVGFNALKVTEDYLFHYRAHSGSASREKQYIAIDQNMPWMRDKLFPMAAPIEKGVPLIHSYSEPKVSVIIPVTESHMKYLPTAINSVLGQTMRGWELIVVNDTDSSIELPSCPFVRIIDVKAHSSSVARNAGIDSAKAPLVVFLDADDWLMPEALDQLCAAYAQGEGRYIYSNWIAVMSGKVQMEEVPEYDPMAYLYAPQHGITVVMATEDARKIRFDETMPVLEDWDFFARCAIAGYHGLHVPVPLYAVRIHADRKTDQWGANPERDKLLKSIVDRYAEYREGAKTMGGCCGGNGGAVLAAKQAAGLSVPPQAPLEDLMQPAQQASVARMEYIGDKVGAISYGGPGITPTGARYRGGNNPMDRYVNADPKDAPWLEGTGVWKRIAAPVNKPQVDVPQMDQVMQLLQRESAQDRKAATMEPVELPAQSLSTGQPMPFRVSDLIPSEAGSDPDGLNVSQEQMELPVPPPADGGMVLADRPRRGRPVKAK